MKKVYPTGHPDNLCPAGRRTSCVKVYPTGYPGNACPAGGRTSCVKVYTAGFDIFYPDAAKRMEDIRNLCRKYGFEPYFQGKKSEPGQLPPDSDTIFKKNLEMIDGCDIVAANVNPFRGEMDCGTAFEIGYAYALGKPVYGYRSDGRSMTEKYGGLTDEEGFTVENFGHPINLMIACSTDIVEGTLEDCLKKIKEAIPE